MNYSDDFRKMIKKYNDELIKMKEKAVLSQNENENNESKAVLTQGEIKNNDSVLPDPFPFTNDYNLPNINSEDLIKGQNENLSGIGKLIVKVFTANKAVPISEALVLVSIKKPDGEHLISSSTTNADGISPVLELATVPIEESFNPEIKNPYATYQIRVSAPDFFTIDSVNVPIFDKQTAIQQFEMLPIPSDFEGNRILNSNDTGPINL